MLFKTCSSYYIKPIKNELEYDNPISNRVILILHNIEE